MMFSGRLSAVQRIEFRVISKIFSAGVFMLAIALCSNATAADAPLASAGNLATCPAAVPFSNGIEIVKAIRVYTAANGESAFEDVTFKGEGKAYFKPGEIFTHTELGGAKKVQLISGPANVILKPHPTPYKEMFLTIQGSSAIVLPNGEKRDLTPGALVIFDDATSKTGHGGTTGPCGYVAINVVPADEAPKP